MKNKKQLFIGVGGTLLILAIIIVFLITNQRPVHLTTKTTELSLNTKLDNRDEAIDWSILPTKKIKLSKTLVLTEPGTYILSGNISNGYIKINTLGNIKLVLNNVTIENKTGPAIYIENASTSVIELLDDTTSTLIDGKNYSTEFKYKPATIYSEDDLVLQGTGTLEVIANQEDAVVSKDDSKVISGSYNITSKDDALRGKDSIYLKNGTFNITSTGDSIKSNKGFVYIENGLFNLTSSKDGIQSETDLLIKNGIFNITSKNDVLSESSLNPPSTKGIKSLGNMVIENAIMNIKTTADGLHSDKSLGIKNGTYTITTLDDGITAANKLIIDDGNITITKSDKGLKAKDIIINNGIIDIASSDEEISKQAHVSINGGTTTLSSLSTKNTLKDYKKVFSLNKGTLLIGSDDNLTKIINHTSNIKVLSLNLDKEYTSTDIITITLNDKVIKTYNSAKSYTTILIATEELKENTKYQLKINDKLYKELKVTSSTIKINN